MAARTFLTHLHDKGWYREDSDEQDLLKKLRTEWIKDGGKWKS
jgi:3-methyladenine DNA glycosylase Tag